MNTEKVLEYLDPTSKFINTMPIEEMIHLHDDHGHAAILNDGVVIDIVDDKEE